MLNEGDILFVRGYEKSLVDDAIKAGEWLMTREEKIPFAKLYTHVCVYAGNNQVLEAQGGRKSGYSNIGDYSGDYDVGHVKGMNSGQRGLFLESLKAQNNLPYDWPYIRWLIVKILTGYDRKYEEHRRRVCCTYVGHALEKVGIHVEYDTPESMALDDIFDIEKG